MPKIWLVIVALLGLLIVAFIGFYSGSRNREISCTLEAKICPDGTSVGRIPPDCEFAPCPAGTSPTAEPTPINSFDSSAP